MPAHLQNLAATADALAALLAAAPAEAVSRQPGPGQWSAGQVLAHLADCELAIGYRLRQLVTQDGPALASFDQDAWAVAGDYAAADPARSLTLFRLLRETNVALLERLTPEQWHRHGQHAERGRQTIGDVADFLVYHDGRHLAQMQRALSQA